MRVASSRAASGLSIKGQALRYLAQREHSRAELERKLLRARLCHERRQKQRDGAGAATVVDHDTDDDGANDGTNDGTDGAADDASTLEQQIAAALDELMAKGFLSDERTAAQWLASKGARYGVNRLRRDLQAKGLDAELVSKTVADARAGEFAGALAVWQRKFGQAPQDAKSRGQQIRFLAGRGFSGDVIGRVLRSADNEE